MRVVTFNAGLAVGVLPHATARVEHVVRALVELDADLLYVQEVWLEPDFERLRDALGPRYHVLRPPPAAAHGGCRREELAALRACAERHCAGLRDEALAECVVSRCASVALSLSPTCLNCLATHPRGSFDEIATRCERLAAVPLPAGAEPSSFTAYGGSLGTALFSKAPIEDHDFLLYASTINARGALHARIRDPELGTISVFGTHFSPGGAEQPPQVDALVAWIDARTKRGAPALLLGDLNMTPSSSLFRQLLGTGFREADERDERATFHAAGLSHGTTTDRGIRLDHVVARDATWRMRVERILDHRLTIDAGGRRVQTTLSDHYGLLATLER